MEHTEQLIGEIMLDNLPKNIFGALRVMAELNYPLNDRRTFIAQLENLSNDPEKKLPEEQKVALFLARGALTVRDFPILTPASGLEKAFAHLSDPRWLDFGQDLDIPDVRDSIEHPPFDAWSAYNNKFIGACVNRAYAFYRYLVDVAKQPWFIAYPAGLAEGQRCMDAGEGLDPSPPYSYDLVDPSDLVLHWYRRRRR